MQAFTVQIERLEPMRVAVAAVTSKSPEDDAVQALVNWARPQGLLDGDFRFFGYDNCQPYPQHTYTTWLSVGKDVQPSGAVEIRDFPGGLFATTELRGVEEIAPRWKQLLHWCLERGYKPRSQPGLEEYLGGLGDQPVSDRHFRLYLPIKE